MTTTPTRAVVPLAVWPVAQTNAKQQRAGRYHADCTAHPGKMLPNLARRIITEYSTPGQTIVDPFAGTGTTIVEAALAGRRSVGVEYEPRWAALADTNLNHALTPGSRHRAEITVGDARQLPDVLGSLAGRVDLIVTSPPYGGNAAVIAKAAWLAGGTIRRDDTVNYATDRDHLGRARAAAHETALAAVYTACFAVLRPGGRMVVVTRNPRAKGRTLDLAGLTVALAQAAGFTYLQHVIALHAAIRDGGLAARPSFWQITNTRHARQHGEPAHVPVHEDVTVLTRPDTPPNAEAADAH